MPSFGLLSLASSFLFLFADAATQFPWKATPFNPSSIPLAVRTPYLSAWLPQGSGTALNAAWPQHWTGQTVGWAGFIKVDGTPYSFLGDPGITAPFTKTIQKSMEFTSTQSIFVMAAGRVDLTVTFPSPVEVGSTRPVAVLRLTGVVAERSEQAVISVFLNGYGSPHSVQVYSDASGVTYQTGEDAVVRTQFVNNSVLLNTKDTKFRAISNTWPVFAFAHDRATLQAHRQAPSLCPSARFETQQSVTLSLAERLSLSRFILFCAADTLQLQNRSSYFRNQFSNISDAIKSFLNDYLTALTRNSKFDAQVQSDAMAISADYAAIVALSTRQTLGATEITISKNGDGSFNTGDVLLFMKVTVQVHRNVNTVDVIFPAYPLLLYVNPLLAKYLLAGLFEYQATGQYPNKFSVHDLGANYPKAIGHNDGSDEAMPVEESGNMIIMALSYAQKSGDNSQLTAYAALLDQWTQFLISDSLIPENQLSTDDFAGKLANQTNLAIKGIVGIKAMSVIAGILGDSEKSSNYSDVASSYVSRWQSLAISSDQSHLTLSYGDSSSWGLSYNLYGDKLLKLDLFPDSIYQMQTNWYRSVHQPFGVPLDTRHTYTKSDWQIWTAAVMTDANARDFFISSVKNTAANGLSSQPFGDWYDAHDGTPETFRARPVVGGHLALLALQAVSRAQMFLKPILYSINTGLLSRPVWSTAALPRRLQEHIHLTLVETWQYRYLSCGWKLYLGR
ncbi:DUF1793-domain-containing protein [Mycena vitilis]|nr:DUF1793-domain-containing protein [Mycena vitilis]